MDFIILNNVQTIFSLLTSDIIGTIISDTSNLILSIIKEDYKSCPDLHDIIYELDLIYKLEIVKNIIIIIPKKYQKIKIINLGMNNVKKIVIEISNLLIKILNIINIHKYKFFYYIRVINYKKELDILKKKTIILDNRTNILLKLLKLLKK